MDQTLGKRISAGRKKVKLTQDQLAEQLGVTAQAVSKWENDQSCPDITTLPRLAEIFGCTTDELLGIEKVHTAEVIIDNGDNNQDGLHISKDGFEFKMDHGSRKNSICFAVLVFALGGLTLANHLLCRGASFWSILWPTAILVYGLFGSIPGFSFGNLLCVAFGAYFLLDNLNILPFEMGGGLALPIALLLFGISLLIKACRQPKRVRPVFRVNRSGTDSLNSCFNIDGNTFQCDSCFCGEKHYVEMPLLSSGSINTSFGEVTVDLSGVAAVAEECEVSINVSFGDCTLLVPSRYRAELEKNVNFAFIHLKGDPAPTCDGLIRVIANASFGEITVWYI